MALLLCGCRAALPQTAGFADYVALGDSLTAGMQSGGLTPQDQRASFPAQLAHLAGIAFGVPEGLPPGCPPPFGQPPALTSCLRAHPFARVDNLGVPGATLYDVSHSTTANVRDLYKPLYGLILSPGETQAQAAQRLRPQFLTLWIGANDVLGPTLRGDPTGATPPEVFAQEYAALLDLLAPLGAHTVLITVPDVTRAPSLIPGPRLAALGLGDASCRTSRNRVSFSALQNRRIPKPVSCEAPYALTPQEFARAQQLVQAYNASIKRLGQARGFGVFDADEFLRGIRFVDYDPQAAHPFGPDFSLDGVHPSTRGYARIARGLAAFLNARFATRIPLR